MIEIGLRDNFSKEIAGINKEIKGLEKQLRELDKSFGSTSKSMTGLQEKQKVLNQLIEKSQGKISKTVQERDKLIQKYNEEKEALAQVTAEHGENSTQANKARQVLVDRANQINKLNEQIERATINEERYTQQLSNVNEQMHRVSNGIQTYDERMESISKSSSQLVSDLEVQEQILQRQNKSWRAYDTTVAKTQTQLRASVETYRASTEELTRLTQQQETLTQKRQENLTVLEQERTKLEEIRQTHSEQSSEYANQVNHINSLIRAEARYEQTLNSTEEQISRIQETQRTARREVALYTQEMTELGNTRIEQNLHKISNTLTTVGENTAGVSAVGAGMGAGFSKLFMDYEQGLAKVSTLVDTKVNDMQKIGADIKQISNETGQDIANLMESAYQALSAGVQVGDLNEFLATSSKLATAGFTDSASAVKLMSQIMNNYGTEAGTAEQIASKLIQTQNLGVTTVAELSSAMAESLSVGKVAGVSFDQVATAFARVTKSGMSTHEAGTGIKSIFEELIDTGSQVSQILKNETGKSFTELMDGGATLADVLQIIQEQADKTGVSFTELWSSKNAGITGLQLLQTEGGSFNEILKEIESSSGSLDSAFNKMADTSAFKLSSSINELKNSLIDIGGALAPVVDGLSSFVSGFANVVNALPTPIKNLTGYLTGLTAVISPLAIGGGKLFGGIVDVFGDLADAGIVDIGNLFSRSVSDSFENATNEAVRNTRMSIRQIQRESRQIDFSSSRQAREQMAELFPNITANTREYREQYSQLRNQIRNEMLDDLEQRVQLSFDTTNAQRDIQQTGRTIQNATREVEQQTERQLNFFDNATEQIADRASDGVGEIADNLAEAGASANQTGGIFSKLWGIIKANPIASIAIGATVAITAFGLLSAHLDKVAHQYRDKMDEINSSIEEHKANMEEIKGQKDNLSGILEEYEELYKKTDKTAEEQERLKQIMEEVAQIDPNAVEYDENGDPIAIKIDKVKELIEELEVAYKKQEVLLQADERSSAKTSQKAYDEESKDLQSRSEKVSYDYDKLVGTNNTTGQKGYKWLKEDSETWDEYFDRMNNEFLPEYDRIKDELQAIHDEDLANREEVSNARKKYYSNELENSRLLSDLSEEEKDTFKNMLDTFDFSEIDDTQVESLFTKLEQGYAKADEESKKRIDSIVSEQEKLNNSYAKGTISAEEYESQTNRTATALSELLDITPEEAKKLLFSIEYDADKNNQTISELDETKAKLIQSLDGWQNLDSKQRVPLALDMMLDENTPDEIKNVISEALADGEITDEEYELIVKAVAELDEQDFEADFYKKWDDMKSKLLEAGDDEKLKKEIAIEYSTKVESLEDLSYFLDELLGYEKTVEIETLIDDGDIEGLLEYIDELPEEQQVAVATAIASSGELDFAELEKFLNELPEEQRTQVINEIISSGDMSPENMKDFLLGIPEELRTEAVLNCLKTGEYTPEEIQSFVDTLPPQVQTTIKAEVQSAMLDSFKQKLDAMSISKTIKVNVEKAVAEQNVDALLASIEGLPPEKQLEIIANALPALTDINEVDQKKIADKVAKINGENSDALGKISDVEVKRILDKNFNINAKDNATKTTSSVISQLGQIVSKNVTVTVTQRFKQIGKAVTSFVGGLFSSASAPEVVDREQVVRTSVISDPVIVDNLGAIQASNTAVSNSATQIASNLDNVVSAMATASSSTKKTSINANYTLNAIKYNIDMLTRMTNILSKLDSQLSELDGKMQRAFGTSKASLLKQEISLLEKQQTLLTTNYNNMSAMASKLKSSLKSQGFKFNDDGSISNYTSKLIALQQAVEKAEKAQKSYTGKSETKQKSLQKAVDNANDKLDKAQRELNEYYNLVFNEMPNVKSEWEDVANAIAQAKAEIIEANHEAKVLYETLQMEVNDYYGGYEATSQSKNEALAEYVDDTNEKIKYLEKANTDIEQQIARQENTIKQANARMKDDRAMLEGYGFKFTKYGNIDGGASTLNSLAKKLSPAEYDAVYAIWQEYMQDITSTIPDAEEEIINLNQAIKDNKEEIEELIKTQKEIIRETKIDVLTNQYDRLSASLDLLEAKQDNAFGKNKLKYIQQQINLVGALTFEQEKLGMQYKANAEELKKQLATEFSIEFDGNGNIKNLENVMSSLNDITAMEELQELADEYNDTLLEYANSEVELEQLNKQIQDLKDSMIELNDEMTEIIRNAWATELENDFTILENKLSQIEAKRELQGANQVELMQQQLEIYKQQREQLLRNLDYQEALSKQLQNELGEYGFVINDDGSIDNIAKQLELLKNNLSDTEFDHVNQLLEDYFDTALDTIPELEQQLIELQKTFEDLEREKLEITADVEEEITKIYEKQVEDKIDAIEKEADARVEALNKAKQAYQRWRDDVEYNDDYDKQLKAVQDLEKQIEIAKRDTSLSGQKRLADLMEELKEEQENLEDLVTQKIDEDINNMFDDEIDRTEQSSEEAIKKIEELWSESNIAEAVQKALQTGVFTDIDGNVTDLKSAMIDMTETSVEYMGVLGDTLREELLSNLQVALDTAQQLDKTMQNIDYNSAMYGGYGYDAQTVMGTTNNNNITVDFSPTISVLAENASVDEEALANLLDAQKDEMISEIQHQIMKNCY